MTKPASPSTEAPACRPWCGSISMPAPDVKFVTAPSAPPLRSMSAYCSDECANSRRPLRPAPRPIERCSCAESMRLRAALSAIVTLNDHGYKSRVDEIARRALALEPEGDE